MKCHVTGSLPIQWISFDWHLKSHKGTVFLFTFSRLEDVILMYLKMPLKCTFYHGACETCVLLWALPKIEKVIENCTGIFRHFSRVSVFSISYEYE